MLSVGQRVRILAAVPTDLGGYTVKKLRRDRLLNDDNTFPSMRIAIISQGIRARPSTGGPIRKNYDGYQGDAQEWLGHHQKATISVTVMCESETPGTDQDTPEVLDTLMYDLEQEIEIWRLGIYWPNDYMKVVPGSSRVTYLPNYMAKGADEHWIYLANLDFQIEYEFSALDPTPNIHAIEFDWGIPLPATDHIILTDVHPPWYEMDVNIRGWKSDLLIDMVLQGGYQEKSASLDVILVNE